MNHISNNILRFILAIIIFSLTANFSVSMNQNSQSKNIFELLKSDTLITNTAPDEYPTAISLSTGFGRGWLNAKGTNYNYNYAFDINLSLNSVIQHFYFNTGIQYSHQSKDTELKYAKQFKGALLYLMPSAAFHAFKERITFFGGAGFGILTSSAVITTGIIFSAKCQYNLNKLISSGIHLYHIELAENPIGSHSGSWSNLNLFLSLNL